jgi:hypothetical protein
LGSPSVIMMQTATTTYVADMTAANPSFIPMTQPYAPPGQAIAVGDGADQAWLATVDPSGTLSVYPLAAQASAPAAEFTSAPGLFPTPAVAVGIGGQSAVGVPPAAVVVASASSVTMTLKSAADSSYPAPAPVQPASCASGPGLNSSAHVTPNSGAAYGAAWVNGCWVQDSSNTPTAITVQPVGGNFSAIDSGYDATDTSAGTDAVVLLGGIAVRGAEKLAATQNGFPVTLSDQTVDASAGTDPSSAGVAVNGVTAATVYQTTYRPTPATQVASAMNVGGAASDDGGQTFHQTTCDSALSVA